jgi:hypothetical protein
MSAHITGLSKEIPNHFVVKSSIDVCKGCRRFCISLIKTIAGNRLATGMLISLPMLVMAGFLIYIETYISDFIANIERMNVHVFWEYKNLIFSPIYTLATITFGFGVVAIVGIKCEFQNILRFSAFVYRGIAHWILLTVFLLMIPILGYLPIYLLSQIVLWSFLPAGLWLFTAAIMTGHADLIIRAIEIRQLSLTVPDTFISQD